MSQLTYPQAHSKTSSPIPHAASPPSDHSESRQNIFSETHPPLPSAQTASVPSPSCYACPLPSRLPCSPTPRRYAPQTPRYCAARRTADSPPPTETIDRCSPHHVPFRTRVAPFPAASCVFAAVLHAAPLASSVPAYPASRLD